jgi:hypothetical protein
VQQFLLRGCLLSFIHFGRQRNGLLKVLSTNPYTVDDYYVYDCAKKVWV